MALLDTILQKGHSSYQKYHLIKMASNINCTSEKWISQKRHLKTYIIGFLKYYQLLATPTITQKLEKRDFKIPWPWVWIILQIKEFPLKNHPAQSLAFFRKVCHCCKERIFVGVAFVYFRWSICHVPFFVGCHFCWKYLMVLFYYYYYYYYDYYYYS